MHVLNALVDHRSIIEARIAMGLTDLTVAREQLVRHPEDMEKDYVTVLDHLDHCINLLNELYKR